MKNDKKIKSLDEVLNKIKQELQKATTKHPTWPNDILHSVSIVSEESGELVREALQLVYEPEKTDILKVEKEAVQVAVTAIRFLMSIDQYSISPSTQHNQ